MSTISVTNPEIQRMRWVEYLADRRTSRGLKAEDNDFLTVRAALSNVQDVAAMLGLVNQSILNGFINENDTTADWRRTVNLPNYLAADLANISITPRLGKVERGGVAPSVGYGASAQGWRLARFGCKFEIDEQDIIDGASIGVYEVALEEIGRSARRVLPDMIYAMLLSNAALQDGIAIFDAGRGNAGTAALADTALDSGMAAIAGQTHTDEQGDPVHNNMQPRYLIVPPALYGLGKRLARDMSTGKDDLVVRAESRIGTAGVVDPVSDEIIVGSNTRWYLSCPSNQAAGVFVGGLYGRLTPIVREYKLEPGTWGMGFDVKLDLAVTIMNPKALYYSTGAA